MVQPYEVNCQKWGRVDKSENYQRRLLTNGGQLKKFYRFLPGSSGKPRSESGLDCLISPFARLRNWSNHKKNWSWTLWGIMNGWVMTERRCGGANIPTIHFLGQATSLNRNRGKKARRRAQQHLHLHLDPRRISKVCSSPAVSTPVYNAHTWAALCTQPILEKIPTTPAERSDRCNGGRQAKGACGQTLPDSSRCRVGGSSWKRGRRVSSASSVTPHHHRIVPRSTFAPSFQVPSTLPHAPLSLSLIASCSSVRTCPRQRTCHP